MNHTLISPFGVTPDGEVVSAITLDNGILSCKVLTYGATLQSLIVPDKNGNPVYNYGRMKGKIKKIGLTSTGKKAARGTVAADPKIFKMGTKLEIPGYGTGVVEDIGGAIKGRHIDLWFPTHEEAKRWGKRYLRIKVVEP